jgi:hypothetical protein
MLSGTGHSAQTSSYSNDYEQMLLREEGSRNIQMQQVQSQHQLHSFPPNSNAGYMNEGRCTFTLFISHCLNIF